VRLTKSRRRALLALAAMAPLVAACRSESSASACGYDSTMRSPLATAPHFHVGDGADPEWRTHLAASLAAMPADSSVHALLVLTGDVTAGDRLLVTSRGGTITDEPTFLDGIVATFSVANLRTVASADASETSRVIDVDLVEVTVLPPCE
jgi:hypothetical protein